MRFALQADGSTLATGMYDYTVEIVTTKTGVATSQSFAGKQAIVNRNASEFGANWWLDGLDRLVDSSAGALLIAGDGGALSFPKSGSTYLKGSRKVPPTIRLPRFRFSVYSLEINNWRIEK